MAHKGQGQRLEQEQRLGLRLSQQQVRFVRMLEMSGAEVVQDMRRELDENPALEVREGGMADTVHESDENVSDAYVSPVTASATTRRGEFISPAAEGESLYEALQRQLDTLELPAVVDMAARYIVGNIDGNGYLRRDLDGIAMDILIAEGEEPDRFQMERALDAVRGLDPAGVGAYDLRECMELQLRRMPPSPERNDALVIVSRYFGQLAKRHFDRMLPGVNGDRERLDRALALIRKLNPKPGGAFDSAGGNK